MHIGIDDGDSAEVMFDSEMLNEDGEIPVALGGDHAVTFPLVEAAAACFGPLNILHIDAHPDLYDDFGGNPRSHASPFARICEAGHAARLVQVGIRTLNRHCATQADRFGVEIRECYGMTDASSLTTCNTSGVVGPPRAEPSATSNSLTKDMSRDNPQE